MTYDFKEDFSFELGRYIFDIVFEEKLRDSILIKDWPVDYLSIDFLLEVLRKYALTDSVKNFYIDQSGLQCLDMKFSWKDFDRIKYNLLQLISLEKFFLPTYRINKRSIKRFVKTWKAIHHKDLILAHISDFK